MRGGARLCVTESFCPDQIALGSRHDAVQVIVERLNEGEHMSEVKLASSLIGKTGIQSVVKPLQVRRNPG